MQKLSSLQQELPKFSVQLTFSDRVLIKQKEKYDFKSHISRFPILKNIRRIASVLHLTDFEIVYWHMINLAMLELGLWS